MLNISIRNEKVTCLFFWIILHLYLCNETYIIVNYKFTYYIISAMEASTCYFKSEILNQKFTNYIKFIVGKTSWLRNIKSQLLFLLLLMQKLVEQNGYKEP